MDVVVAYNSEFIKLLKTKSFLRNVKNFYVSRPDNANHKFEWTFTAIPLINVTLFLKSEKRLVTGNILRGLNLFLRLSFRLYKLMIWWCYEHLIRLPVLVRS